MAGPRARGHPGPDVEATLARIEKLQTSRAYRDATGLYAVEGVRNFIRAAESGVGFAAIVVSDKLLKVPPARQLLRARRRAGVPCVPVTPEQFRRIARAPRASGIAAILRQHWSDLQRTPPGAGLCWIALEAVRAPGNLGTLIRTSAAVGGAGFILLGNAVDPFDPAVVRATMGALFGQAILRSDPSSLARWTERHRCAVVGASPDGPCPFNRVAYPRRTILMLGEERRGLTAQQRAICHRLVRIPMTGPTDSLNLSVAGSLLLYEVFRKRAPGPGEPIEEMGDVLPAGGP